ncbi:DUF6517 family protein [Natrialbaceae archaeon GCM10025810]|uniref:DUF6517 family protein n=1 Tax=Halovalidus salilacus TaxID=3075124 RepID=UPI00360AD56B
MIVSRRQFLAAGATAGAGALAGCSGFLEDELSSSVAGVSASALAETGYGERTVEEVVVSRTVGRFGFEHTVEVTNWYAEYDRAITLDALGDLGSAIGGPGGSSRLRASIVSVLTTPQISFLGRTFNPVGEYSTDDLVALIQDRYDELEDVRRVDETTLSFLGEEARVVRYEARARLVDVGTSIDVYLQVSKPVEHGDDLVICVAVYPQALGYEVESDAVRTLLENVEHE